MNSIHNNGENDTSLNDGLDKLSQAYARLEQEEPPELLDQAILNSAHRAVEKKPHWMKFGWLHGLTTTAVFVLAFSLILNQPESTPVFEDEISNNEPTLLRLEKAAKKQSSEAQSDDSSMEMKSKGDLKRDMPQSLPAAAAPESPVKETAPEDRLRQSAPGAQRSMHVQESRKGKRENFDKDAEISEMLQEEEVLGETDLMVDSVEGGMVNELARPAAVTGSAVSEVKTQFRADSEAEQWLLAIIELKQADDDRWETELKSFRESYPDYPLPDELTR